MKELVVVGWCVPRKAASGRLGVVDAIRDAVQSVKKHNPHLKNSLLKDVTLKRRGDEIRLTFYFLPSS